MGACASIHKSPRVVIVGIGSKAKRIFTASPTKERPLNGKNPVGEFHFEEKKHVESSELGSKEEIFFDSRAWLDSDCEDDFFSVNGDFTPSRGSTPNHQITMPSTPRTNVVISVPKFADPNTEPSPATRKKLADLLREAQQVEKPLSEQNAADEENTYKLDSIKFVKPLDSNPYGFEFSAPKKQKAPSTLRCCLPISPRRMGFDERSAKMSSRQCAV